MRVGKQNCMQYLAEKVPGFADFWSDYMARNPGIMGIGLSLDIYSLSEFTIFAFQNNNESLLATIFSLVDELLADGEESVQNAMTTCYLEDLLAKIDLGVIQAASLAKYLRGESLEYCKAWNKFTGVHIPEIDDKLS